MKYERIFWLEDTPDILGDILCICARHQVDKDSLFPRITFAPDYETGAEIVHGENFDLYILDADFPEATSQEWKEYYWNFMSQVSKDTKHFHFKDKYGEGNFGRSANNFSCFFAEFLQRKPGKTIVYSISTMAPLVAFHLGLPFYSKALDKDMIKDNVTRNLNDEYILEKYVLPLVVPKNIDFLEQWECGSRYELVERYLL